MYLYESVSYKGIFGEPVAWPSQEEFHVRTGSIPQLLATHQAIEDADYADAQLVVCDPPSDEDDVVERILALEDSPPCHTAEMLSKQMGYASETPKRRRILFENCKEEKQNAMDESRVFMRKTPTYFSDAQKIWLRSQHAEDNQLDEVVRAVPSKPSLKKILEKGIQDGVLTDDNTLEGIRSFFARVVKDAAALVDLSIVDPAAAINVTQIQH